MYKNIIISHKMPVPKPLQDAFAAFKKEYKKTQGQGLAPYDLSRLNDLEAQRDRCGHRGCE